MSASVRPPNLPERRSTKHVRSSRSTGRICPGGGDEHRHEARKDAKKLRYAAEFFRSLFSDKWDVRPYKRFIGAMEALQDELGALNDFATGPDVLEGRGGGWSGARHVCKLLPGAKRAYGKRS